MRVNRALIAAGSDRADNQPMVGTIPQPKAFKSFKEWVTALSEVGGIKQVTIATAGGTSPQMVTKWRAGSSPSIDTLKKLATAFTVPLQDLRDLVDGVHAPAGKPAAVNLTCKTEMGARVGRKWEELDDPGQTQILMLIETLGAMQLEIKHAETRRQKTKA